MIIKNESKNLTLAKDATLAKTLKSKVFGLILHKSSDALILKTRFGIHTFGMRRSIDVIVLNNLGRVVRIKKAMQPNRILIWNPKYDSIVELNSGLIKSKVDLGDRLSFRG